MNTKDKIYAAVHREMVGTARKLMDVTDLRQVDLESKIILEHGIGL